MPHSIRSRKILNPQKFRETELRGTHDHPEKSKKDRNLDKHRKTTTDRIDLMLLEELHRLHLHPLRIILEFLPERLHRLLDFRHPSRRTRSLCRQRPKNRLDQNSHHDNRAPVVRQKTCNRNHHAQQKFTDKTDDRPTELHHAILVFPHRLQSPVFLRSGIKITSQYLLTASFNPAQIENNLSGNPLLRLFPFNSQQIDRPGDKAFRIGFRRKNTRKKLILDRCPLQRQRLRNKILRLAGRKPDPGHKSTTGIFTRRQVFKRFSVVIIEIEMLNPNCLTASRSRRAEMQTEFIEQKRLFPPISKIGLMMNRIRTWIPCPRLQFDRIMPSDLQPSRRLHPVNNLRVALTDQPIRHIRSRTRQST